MARTDTRIVEGLAQFYTRVVCERLSARHPGALLAYRQLLNLQGGAYVVHKDWVKEDESGGEVVRSALVECRRRGVLTYDGFRGLLTQRREGMGVTRKAVEKPVRKSEQPGLFGNTEPNGRERAS
jgi:hypothetical protein